MIPVKVEKLLEVMLHSDVGFVVLLKSLKDNRSVPIFIGGAEAQAIAIRMRELQVPRPLTHDLLKNVLDFFECRLKRIEICDLVDGTFYAKLVLERDGGEMEMDSRPSDAIALALRCAAPIFVAEKVMDEAGRVFEAPETPSTPSGESADGTATGNAGEKLSPVELLKQNLGKAVKDERYEDAARIRDEIRRIEESHVGN
jgi:uncharacterized protein